MKIQLIERRVFTDPGGFADYPEDLALRLIKEGKAKRYVEAKKKQPAADPEPAKEPVPAEALVPEAREQEHMVPGKTRKRGPWK